MINVVNGKIDGFIGSNKVYIGRYNKYYGLKESPLCNKHKVVKDGRNNAIALYKVDLWYSIKNMRDCRPRRVDSVMMELLEIVRREKQYGTIELVCFCKKKDVYVPCHGDIIASAINWLKTQDWFMDLVR
jgi:Domain of unknown function (DUF4326)